jgi:CBS domain-containing protein
MKILEILSNKGHEVITIAQDRTVLKAAEVLVEHNIGGLVVTDGGRLCGIVTERDILRATARSPGRLDAMEVSQIMTREVITARPDQGLMEMMDVMTENKIRHLPVLAGDRLAGIISIGDLVNACRVVAEDENSHLRGYIQGVG